MPNYRLHEKLLYAELSLERLTVGGQRIRFKDYLKSTLKKYDIEPTHLDHLVTDRDLWKETTSAGLEAYTVKIDIAAPEKRLRRHR